MPVNAWCRIECRSVAHRLFSDSIVEDCFADTEASRSNSV